MRIGWRAVLVGVVVLLATRGQAAEPLALVPQEADFAIAISRPGELVDRLWVVVNDPRLQQLPNYAEALDQVSARRFLQLVRYAERQLGKPWRELVDELAGGGIVLAGKYGPQPSPVLLVVQGRDGALMARAAQLFAEVLEQELARRDLPSERQVHTRSGLQVTQVGQVYFAVAGAAFLLSNRLEVFDFVAPLAEGKAERSLARAEKWQTAKTTIPPEVLVWAWLDLRPIKQLPEVRQALELPSDLAILHVLFGRYLDAFKRSDFITAYVTATSQDVRLTLYAPAGWQGRSPSATTQVPADGRARLRPPLQVPGTIYTSSFYFDPGSFLRQREKLLTEQQRRAFEEFDKNSAKFLLGMRFSELVMNLGTRHRLIVAQPDRKTYSVAPANTVPSFAILIELKEQEKLGNRLAAILRGAALLATFATRLELVEEDHGGVKLVGYRFTDNEANRNVQNGILFNFSPCFAQLGDQFLLCSTLDLGRKIIAAWKAEKERPGREESGLFVDVFSWEGLSELLGQAKEQLVVQYMLERVQSPESAKRQADAVIQLVRSLGQVELRYAAEAQSSRLEVHWKLGR